MPTASLEWIVVRVRKVRAVPAGIVAAREDAIQAQLETIIRASVFVIRFRVRS